MPALVWNNEKWWVDQAHIWQPHDPEPTDDDAGTIRYYMTPEKREARVRTRIKAGRYLMKYFGGCLPEKRVKFYAEWQTTGTVPAEVEGSVRGYEFRFATTPDEIVDVYKRCPTPSCMDGTHFPDDAISPVRVYGAGDLAVAYLQGKDGAVWGRALVWPEKKWAGTIFPSGYEYYNSPYGSSDHCRACRAEMIRQLKEAGYRLSHEMCGSGFAGARLLKIPYKDMSSRFLMPHVDGTYCARDGGPDYWVLEERVYPRPKNCVSTDEIHGYVAI